MKTSALEEGKCQGAVRAGDSLGALGSLGEDWQHRVFTARAHPTIPSQREGQARGQPRQP